MDSEELKKPEEASRDEAGDTAAVDSEAAPNAETQNSAAEREVPKSDDGDTDQQKSSDSKVEEKCEVGLSGTEQAAAEPRETPTGGETKKQEVDSEKNNSKQDETSEVEKKENTETKDGEKATEETTEKQNGEAEGAVGGADPRNLNGKYSHVKSENLDDLFKAIGVPWLMRKMLKRFNHSTEIVQEGEKFDIKLCTGFMVKEWKFTVGEDFEDKPMGWSNDTMTVHSFWDGDKLVMNSVPKSEKAKSKPMKITRHLNGDELTMVLEIDNVICTRIFKKKKN